MAANNSIAQNDSGGRSKTKSKRRRSAKKASSDGNVNYNKPMAPIMHYSSNAPMRKAKVIIGSSRISQDGMNFLKCAFAPPDFSGERVSGVPDNFSGRSLVKKHKIIKSFTFLTGNDYYILQMPTPGVSYWMATVPAGSPLNSGTTFSPQYVTDFASVFGSVDGSNAADVVTKFRYVSQCIEIVNTTNEMTWSGSIQAFRMPMTMATTTYQIAGAAAQSYQINGLQGANSQNANAYTAPFKAGFYGVTGNGNGPFNFSDILEGNGSIPRAGTTPVGAFGIFNGCVTGFGLMDSMLIKVSGLSSTNTCILKTWSCVEYQVLPSSALYEYSNFSPREDELALKCYREILNNLPVGVPYFENDGFWERVLKIIKTVSGLGQAIPGPYGLISSGIHSAAVGIEQLTL